VTTTTFGSRARRTKSIGQPAGLIEKSEDPKSEDDRNDDPRTN
jgi:hypothetical protein